MTDAAPDAPETGAEPAAPEPMPSGTGAALAIRPFRYLFLNTFLTWFASGFLMITVQEFILQTLRAGGNEAAKVRLVGLAPFFAMAPLFLFSAFAGVLADRLDRRRLLIFGQAARGVLGAVLLLLYLTGRLTIPLAYLLSFALGTAQAIIQPTRHSLVPNLVPRSYLLNAVALTNLAQYSTMVLAPVAASLLIKGIGVGASLFAHVLILGFAILPLFLLRVPAGATVPAPLRRRTGIDGVLHEIAEGLRDCWHNPRLRALLFTTALPGIFFMGPFSALAPLMARDVYGSDVRAQGLMMGVMGIGLIVGGLAVAKRHDLTGLGTKMVYVLMSGGVFLFAIGSIPILWIGLPLMLLWGAGGGVFFNLNLTLTQREVDDAMRGRVMSIVTMATQGAGPIGNVAATFLASVIGARTTVALGVQHTLQIAGLCVVAGTLSLVLTRARVMELQ